MAAEGRVSEAGLDPQDLIGFLAEPSAVDQELFAPLVDAAEQSLARTEVRTELRNFENVFVPGLLQTMPYAKLRLAEGLARTGGIPDDLDEAVAARMQRQQVLYRPDKRFHFVVTEAVLRYRLGPVDVLIGQLDRLAASLSVPNVRLGIIGFAAELPLPPIHGFHLLDRAVIVETLTSSLTLTDEAELIAYRDIFERLAGAAVYGRDAQAVIARVQADLAADDAP